MGRHCGCSASDRRAAAKPWRRQRNLDSSGEAPRASRAHAPAAAPAAERTGSRSAKVFSGCNCIAAQTVALPRKSNSIGLSGAGLRAGLQRQVDAAAGGCSNPARLSCVSADRRVEHKPARVVCMLMCTIALHLRLHHSKTTYGRQGQQPSQLAAAGSAQPLSSSLAPAGGAQPAAAGILFATAGSAVWPRGPCNHACSANASLHALPTSLLLLLVLLPPAALHAAARRRCRARSGAGRCACIAASPT